MLGEITMDGNACGAVMSAMPGRQGLWLLMALALVVRLGFYSVAAEDPQRFLMPDSVGYLTLAAQAAQVYSLPPAEGSDITKSLNRTPLYPLFLRAVQEVTGGGLGCVVLTQVAVSLATVLLVWRLGTMLLGPGPALWAALLLALDPTSAVYANLLLTETLFTCGLVLGALLLARALDQRRASGAAGCGLALGLATLVRPASLYLPVFALPLVLFGARGRGLWWRGTALLLAGFLVLAGAWVWRNQQVSGQVMFTSMEAANLNFRAVWAVADQRGIAFDEALAAIDAMRLPQAPGRHVLKQFNGLSKDASVRLMLENPTGLAKSSLRGLGWYFFGPGRAGLAQLLNWDLTGTAVRLASALGMGFVLLVYAAGLWGCRVLIRERAWRTLCFILVFIVYFSILSAAPEAYARFRVPVMPFFCLLGGVGISAMMERVRARRATANINPTPGKP